MALKVNIDSWWERFEGVWEDAGEGNLSETLDMLAAIVPECAERIERARSRISSGSVRVVLDGDKETGEMLVFEATNGPFTWPDHVHNRSPFASYGERIWTLEGRIFDISDDGEGIFPPKSDDMIEHGPETRHQPRVGHWWVGIFYQPAGSRLVPVQSTARSRLI